MEREVILKEMSYQIQLNIRSNFSSACGSKLRRGRRRGGGTGRAIASLLQVRRSQDPASSWSWTLTSFSIKHDGWSVNDCQIHVMFQMFTSTLYIQLMVPLIPLILKIIYCSIEMLWIKAFANCCLKNVPINCTDFFFFGFHDALSVAEPCMIYGFIC